MKRRKKETVFVGMSGGVDSSVAALLLQKKGYAVVGVFMRCYNVDGCAERDAEDARRVAEKLDIPFYVWDFEKEYKERVVEYMVREYREGRTPNPDVACNREVKFGLFFDRARALGADYVSTGHYVKLRATPTREAVGAPTESVGAGHYVRVVQSAGDVRNVKQTSNKRNDRTSNIFRLYQAKDTNKDQSYFLWTLTQRELAHCLFPIGEYLKPEIRAIARKAKLPTAEKKDSQGICFLGQVTLEDFLKTYIPENPGEVLTTDGERIGTHHGTAYYTIGQRHGLDLKAKNVELGRKGRQATKAHYVTMKDARTNTITVAEGSEHPSLYRKEVDLMDVNFVVHAAGRFAAGDTPVLARVRYRQPLSSAMLCVETEPFDKFRVKLVFDQPQKFVAEGQSAVFYSKEGEMLGGGAIGA